MFQSAACLRQATQRDMNSSVVVAMHRHRSVWVTAAPSASASLSSLHTKHSSPPKTSHSSARNVCVDDEAQQVEKCSNTQKWAAVEHLALLPVRWEK